MKSLLTLASISPVHALLMVAGHTHGPLRLRLLRAARQASKSIGPNLVQPGMSDTMSMGQILGKYESTIHDMFLGKPQADAAVQAALHLPMSAATIERQLQDILASIPAADNESEESEALDHLRDALGDVVSSVTPILDWATTLRSLVDRTITETRDAPVFPTLPKSVMPSPDVEVTQTPIIVKNEDNDDVEDTEDQEEEQATQDTDDDLDSALDLLG